MLFQDSDGDGSYTSAEFTGAAELFQIIDHDKDGTITAPERHSFLSRSPKTEGEGEDEGPAGEAPPAE